LSFYKYFLQLYFTLIQILVLLKTVEKCVIAIHDYQVLSVTLKYYHLSFNIFLLTYLNLSNNSIFLFRINNNVVIITIITTSTTLTLHKTSYKKLIYSQLLSGTIHFYRTHCPYHNSIPTTN